MCEKHKPCTCAWDAINDIQRERDDARMRQREAAEQAEREAKADAQWRAERREREELSDAALLRHILKGGR